MKLYYVSLLIQDTENSKPWLLAMTDVCLSVEVAIKVIESAKQTYRVLSAWIDTFDWQGNKSTVFHKCYVNAIGNVNIV